MYCKARLRAPHAGLTLVWSWLEATDRYADFLGCPAVRKITALCDRVAAFGAGGEAVPVNDRAIVYIPDKMPTRTLTDREHVAQQFAFFCRIVSECKRARVVVEELKHVTSPSWAPPAWSSLSTAGAHDHLELIATAQRPTMIDKDFIANCSEVRCYRCAYEEDARSMGRFLRVPFEELIDLPTLHYRHRIIEERSTLAGMQEIVLSFFS